VNRPHELDPVPGQQLDILVREYDTALWGTAPGDLDGDLVREVARIDYEKFASVAEGDPDAAAPVRDGFLLLADGGGKMDAPLRIGSLLFVNRAYDADEIASLGLPGSQGIPPPR